MHGSGWSSFIQHDPSRPQPKVDAALLRRVAGWVWPYRRRVALMLVLLLIISLVELVPPLLYARLIDSLALNEATGRITLTPGRLNQLALGLLAVPIASSLLGAWQRHQNATVGEGLIYDLRVAAYSHLQRLGLRFFTATRTGEITSRLENDVVGAQNAVVNTVPNVLSSVLTLSTTLAIMLRLEWRLTLLAVAVVPLFVLPAKRIGLVLRQIRRENSELSAAMSSQLLETVNVSGALLIRVFGRQADSIGRYAERAAAVRDIGIRRAVVSRWFFFGLGIATAVGTAVMYWAGGHLVLAGEISPGLIVAFAAYLNRLFGPITSLSNIQVEFVSSLVSFERLFEYLDLVPEIGERPGALDLDHVTGDVRFEGVGFAYPSSGTASPGGTTWSLADIDFTMRHGETVALVGPSGAGKTTISYLMARLYDPTSGRVTLDGHDLRDVTLASIARHVGVVTQESYLFHDTIRANLLFAAPDADDAALESACRAANIHTRILDLEHGYDTVVGERGYRLSGGEKQRLALARVILKNPAVLVLDEATSHLDTENEALVQEALGRVMRGRTNLVIAHRLSTVQAADQILVVEGGRLVERGSHASLLAADGRYADLYNTQFTPRALATDALTTRPGAQPAQDGPTADGNTAGGQIANGRPAGRP